MSVKPLILQLVATSVAAFDEVIANPPVSIREEEAAANRAVGYLEAAEALLNRHGEFFNELIEHPDFITARRMARTTGAR